MEKTICELFAGVGGFRLGFEKASKAWRTVWFSQWEPGAKTQWAHECYVAHFHDCVDLKGELKTGVDIATVDKKNIPDHTVLVGGFPCQDYSVAHPLPTSKGIEGKKGVLWWQIRDTLIAKNPAFCVFENVDRLLKSPANQRGRDFGVILSCLCELGYSVEWRVVNAAVYGAAQRRRRVFIFAYRNDTKFGESQAIKNPRRILEDSGFMSKAFPIDEIGVVNTVDVAADPVDVSDNFVFEFQSAGYCSGNRVYTTTVKETEEPAKTIAEIRDVNPDAECFVDEQSQIEKWTFLKGAKKIKRTSKSGHEYVFSEGPIAFPDPLDRPGRTMLTSEATLNRSSHILRDPATGRLRTLTPLEAERLQGFDDGWTAIGGMPRRMRYFCMGNALVVPMITRMANVLGPIVGREPARSSK